MEPLDDAFSGFNETMDRLRLDYAQLAQSVAGLNVTMEDDGEPRDQDPDASDGSKAYLTGILESINTGILITDPRERITHFNRQAEELTGYSAQEALGMSCTTFFGEQVRGDDPSPTFAKACVPDTWEERLLETKDGDLVPVELNVSPILIGDEDAVRGYVMVFRDVSEQKVLEEEIERARTLTVLGEMAAVLAHEIRNPLGGINGFATLLERDFDADDPRRMMVRKIIEGVTTLDRIVSKLFVFTRPMKTVMRKLDLWAIIQDGALSFVRQECAGERGNIRITKVFPKEPADVEGDPEMLTEVFLNLFRNAVQAMQEGGELRVQGEVISDAEGGRQIQVRISDTGMGISPEDIEKIFLPFYTTKTVGTGLGLAIAHRIVRLHKGILKAESELGKGSSFVVTLPAC